MLGLGFSIRGKGFSAFFCIFYSQPYWSLVKHHIFVIPPETLRARMALQASRPRRTNLSLLRSDLQRPKPEKTQKPHRMGWDPMESGMFAWNMRKKQRFED